MQEASTTARDERPAAGKRLAIGVQFHVAGRLATFLTDDETLARGDDVVVEVEGGTAIGRVAAPPRELAEGAPADARRVLRRATAEDLDGAAKLCERALECFAVCRDRILWRNLPMKLVDAELAEGGRKVIFTFFAEERVDFRALVKELAATLRLRIEMRQVGSRDESKIVGCLGPCGLTTCCSTHLRQFQSISIAMAKHQGLAPNPAKLTGMCGKLKCCLSYEMAAYDECRQGLPKAGASVETPEGAGKVTGHNVLKRECFVRLYGGGEGRFPCAACRPLTSEERDRAVTAAREAQEQAEERWRSRRQARQERQERQATSRLERAAGGASAVGGGAEQPAASEAERRPAGGAAEKPAEGRVEQRASIEAEKPAAGGAERHAASNAERPAASGASSEAERRRGKRRGRRHGRHRHDRSGKR